MRTGLFLLAGFLFLAASLIVGKLFAENYPGASTAAAVLFVVGWLVIAGFNMWTGVSEAGYSVAAELPILTRPRGGGDPDPMEIPVTRSKER